MSITKRLANIDYTPLYSIGADSFIIRIKLNSTIAAHRQLDRVLGFQSRHKSKILEYVPYPVEQNQPDCQRYKDAVHCLRRREIPQKRVHITPKCAENGCGNHIKQIHHLLGYPSHDFI